MERLKHFKTYPFGLFLWLEWLLLGSAILGQLPGNYASAQYRIEDKPITFAFTIPLICLLALGLMGLKLPKNNSFSKWVYLGLQIILVMLPSLFARDVSYSIYACLVVTVRNCLIFKPKQCCLANILLFLSLFPVFRFMRNFQNFQRRVSRYQNMTPREYERIINMDIVSSLVEAALCIILIWIIVKVVMREYKSQQQLAIAREQLRQYALKAEDRATVCERNRIAREIHDSVGHVLTAQTIQLNNAIAFWQVDPDKSYQFIAESKELVATALKEIRHSINTLRSDPIEGKSLYQAIALLFREFSHRTQINPDYRISLKSSVTEEIKLTIYRTIQESLTNIARHSQATKVKVELQSSPHHLYLSIEDNGKGFNPEQNTTGFGIQGMKERVTAVSGNLKISSSLGYGCIIIIQIPFSSINND